MTNMNLLNKQYDMIIGAQAHTFMALVYILNSDSLSCDAETYRNIALQHLVEACEIFVPVNHLVKHFPKLYECRDLIACYPVVETVAEPLILSMIELLSEFTDAGHQIMIIKELCAQLKEDEDKHDS